MSTQDKKSGNHKRPLFWPKRRKWPPTKNRVLVEIKETLPPIYILNDGTEVKGEWHNKKKVSTRKHTTF